MTANNQDKSLPEPINLSVNTWQRSTDVSLSYRIKSTSNYQIGRLARIEGRSRNFQDMVLLNRWGRVAEATGSCILVIRENKIYTPPASEGALESITLDFVESLAKSRKIEFIRQPIDRTELAIADELAICGTLSELVPVKLIDDFSLNTDGTILNRIRKDFFDVVRGKIEHPDLESTSIQL